MDFAEAFVGWISPFCCEVFVLLSHGMFMAEQTPVWICVCPVSCIKGTPMMGCHFVFLCSGAHIAVYCYAPDFASLNLALALI